MKRLHVVPAASLLVLASLAGCKKPPEETAALTAAKVRGENLPKIHVATAAVQDGEVSRTLELTGTLLAEEQSNVTTQVPGVVSETPVDVGDVVKKGDVLLRLDDREARMRLAAAEAQVMQARARLSLPLEDDGKNNGVPQLDVENLPEVRVARASFESAKADLERNTKLHKDGALSDQMKDLAELKVQQAQSQLDMARNGVAQATAGLVAAQVQVQMARKAVADTYVRAPYAGAVVRRNVSVGEFASPQMPLVQVVSTDRLRLVLDVPESAVAQMAVGHEVILSVQGLPGQSFTGKITRVAPAIDPQTRALRAEATVENNDHKLRPGMFAQARVALPLRQVALFVPREAVLSQAGINKVFVMSGDHVEERIVLLGEGREDLIEVRGELKRGDRVVTKDIDKLTDGAPVEG